MEVIDALVGETRRELHQEHQQRLGQQLQHRVQQDVALDNEIAVAARDIVNDVDQATPGGDNHAWLVTQKIASIFYKQQIKGTGPGTANERLVDMVETLIKNGFIDPAGDI